MKEFLIFGAFGALQVAFHAAHRKMEDRHSFLYKIRHSHFLVWGFHPAVTHAVQDYAIHFVIYSGKVFGAH